ncbi:MAG: APC family permease [Ktedonobacteraceae bacterium]
MAKSASSSGLFVRQASGLVRDVSMTNALFFNIAAFVGTSVGWAVAFYALFPEWQGLGVSAYAWMALLTGIACYFLGMIFASLTTAMPRSGGDYVFTSRIISPFWGWLESWTLVGSALTIIGFEIIVAIRNIQLTGILLGVAFPGNSFFGNAQNWFQDNPSKIIAGIVVMLIIAGVSVLRTRTFHKVVTGLSIFAIISVAISFFGAFSIDSNAMNSALPALGTSSKAIMDAATKGGYSPGTPDFSFTGLIVLAGLVSVVLFQFIGFQFSSYIAGEVKGNIKRTVFFAVVGALIFAVFMNTLYIDVLGNHFGFNLTNAWGYLYWNGGAAPLNGQPPFTPVMATAVHPGAWPLWLIVAMGNITLNILLCPVYAIFLSRIVLAWALDRQVPEWFSEVDERTNAPLRVIVIAILLGAVFYVLTFFGVSPASTIFFGVLLSALTWIMPGLNAILMPYRRPDLFALTNNTRNFLGLPRLVWYGIVWLIFIIPVYLAAAVWPVIKAIQANGASEFITFNSTDGVAFSLAVIVVGIIIYFVMKAVNTSSGINTKMMFHELPPD